MVTYDHKSYIPITMTYYAVPYIDELLALQQRRLDEKSSAQPRRLPAQAQLKRTSVKDAEAAGKTEGTPQ